MLKISQPLINRMIGTIVFLFILLTSTLTGIVTSEGKIINTSYKLNTLDFSLSYSTFFGGDSSDGGYKIAVANDGNLYVTGYTFSNNLPTLNAYDSSYNGGAGDAFVAKFSANGSLLWSTYLGGNNNDYGNDIAVASDGSCYITGYTDSSNFPSLNTFNPNNLDDNTFVTKFSTNGTLLWSVTYHLGISEGYGIAVASDGSCYVTGWIFPVGIPCLSTNDITSMFWGDNIFVTKFSVNGSLIWSIYIEGSNSDYGYGIAVASDGCCYVTGETGSGNLPIKYAHDDIYNGGLSDAFVFKLSTNGSILWGSYLGGSDSESAHGIAVSDDGTCYLIGETKSPNFPTLNAYDNLYDGLENDAFITKFSVDGSLIWSTYLGGKNYDVGIGIAVDSEGHCYTTGYTYSNDFPVSRGCDSSYGGNIDAFITMFTASGSLIWSSYLGGSSWDAGQGIAIISDGSYFVTGFTASSNFPILNGYDDTYNGGHDVFITQLGMISCQASTNGILIFIVIMPIMVFVLRKRRK